jgi:hypothetical protein
MRPALVRLLALSALIAGPAAGQGLGGLGLPSPVGGVPPVTSGGPGLGAPGELVGRTVSGVLDPAEGTLQAVTQTAGQSLSGLRRKVVAQLLRNRRLVDVDEAGQPVVRGEVLAIGPSDAALTAAQAAGFRIDRRSALEGLDIASVVLVAPRSVTTVQAVARLRKLDPAGTYDFNHLYQAAGEARPGAAVSSASPPPGPASGARLGLVDGSAAVGHPALRRTRLTQRAFGPGGARVTDHATAVASLMAGAGDRFHGAAPGAELYVADVYGPTAAGGSAEAIARGLAWLAQSRVKIVNISLVGPSNSLLQAAVRALEARGCTIIAAVGNDGPAAPPLYPAAYPGVVAVTGVDGRKRVLPEAGRGTHVDFAAPGADMAAAGAKGGFLSVRGTSFAAPLVAGALAREPADVLARKAEDLGAPGPDAVDGRGLVQFGLRTDPAMVGARAQVRGH